MDYRDTDELYSKKAERKYERLTRKQRQSEDTKNIIVTTLALAVTFCMVTVMVSQLASCSTPPPPPPTLEERWNESMYKAISSLGLTATMKENKIIFVEGEALEDN